MILQLPQTGALRSAHAECGDLTQRHDIARYLCVQPWLSVFALARAIPMADEYVSSVAQDIAPMQAQREVPQTSPAVAI